MTCPKAAEGRQGYSSSQLQEDSVWRGRHGGGSRNEPITSSSTHRKQKGGQEVGKGSQTSKPVPSDGLPSAKFRPPQAPSPSHIPPPPGDQLIRDTSRGKGHFHSNRMLPQASISSWPAHGAKFVHTNFKSPSQSLAVSTLHKIPSSTSLLRLKVTSEMPRKNRKTNCNRTKHTFLVQKVGSEERLDQRTTEIQQGKQTYAPYLGLPFQKARMALTLQHHCCSFWVFSLPVYTSP